MMNQKLISIISISLSETKYGPRYEKFSQSLPEVKLSIIGVNPLHSATGRIYNNVQYKSKSDSAIRPYRFIFTSKFESVSFQTRFKCGSCLFRAHSKRPFPRFNLIP